MDHRFSERLERGVALFNEASFFEAHEVWEDAWRESDGDARLFLQGLIQIAAGFVKLQRGQPRGLLVLLDQGAAKLQGLAPSSWGLEIGVLLDEVAAWRAIAARMLETGDKTYEAGALPRLRLRPDGSRR